MSRLEHHVLLVAACIVAAAGLTLPAAAGGNTRADRARHAVHHRHRRHHRRRHHQTTTPAAPAQCAGADSQSSAASLDLMRSAVVCLVNQQRIARGLPALTASDQLNRSAQAWTTTMVLTGRFTHGPGDAFARRIGATGYAWQSAGENIAAGFPTPRLVVAAWMASTDHCRNILNPSYRDVGTGESDSTVGANGSGTWTQDFGLRLGQPAPSSNRGPMDGCPY